MGRKKGALKDFGREESECGMVEGWDMRSGTQKSLIIVRAETRVGVVHWRAYATRILLCGIVVSTARDCPSLKV